MRASQSLIAGTPVEALPEPFASWFRARGWRPHAHQLALLDLAGAGRDVLLIAPTGGGKTLAGFLPSLIDLALRKPGSRPEVAIHTLYVSPLKALAVDIARNLASPVAEMALRTIVEAPMLRVRLAKGKGGALKPSHMLAPGRVVGEVEEYFIEQLLPGDTFVFAGEVLRFEGLRENDAIVTRTHATEPKVPAYEGGKFPLSTYLAERVRRLIAESRDWQRLPNQVSDWLRLQAEFSLVPGPDRGLIETFPGGGRHYLVCYAFEGRLAHQSLGMLLTRRLERARAAPLGFVANEYALAIWGLSDLGAMVRDGRLDLGRLFNEDMLGDDLDAWLAESNLMKRSFRVCAIISGLIERRHPGQEKTGRQMTASSDLIYDVLREHEPGHILLKAAFADAATGLIDVYRLGDFLRRIKGRIRHTGLNRVSPLAVPVMLEIGRESVPGEASEILLRETVEDLVAEALRGHATRQT